MIRTNDFSLAEHSYRRFDAVVKAGMTPEELCDGAYWANVAPKMKAGDEIRAISEDFSFVAYMIVMFARGTDVRLKILTAHELDSIDRNEINSELDDYEVTMRGPRKWSIVKKSTGEVIREDIATQVEALKELEQYRRALAA